MVLSVQFILSMPLLLITNTVLSVVKSCCGCSSRRPLFRFIEAMVLPLYFSMPFIFEAAHTLLNLSIQIEYTEFEGTRYFLVRSTNFPLLHTCRPPPSVAR